MSTFFATIEGEKFPTGHIKDAKQKQKALRPVFLGFFDAGFSIKPCS